MFFSSKNLFLPTQQSSYIHSTALCNISELNKYDVMLFNAQTLFTHFLCFSITDSSKSSSILINTF